MMKPETKRWLAKEWLIYLGLATAIFILVCVDQYDRPYDEFWERTDIGRRWNRDVTNAPLGVKMQAHLYAVAFFPFAGLVKLEVGKFLPSTLAVYLLFWVPRLTVRAVQTLRRKPEGTE